MPGVSGVFKPKSTSTWDEPSSFGSFSIREPLRQQLRVQRMPFRPRLLWSRPLRQRQLARPPWMQLQQWQQ